MENSKNPELENKNDLQEAFLKARANILNAHLKLSFNKYAKITSYHLEMILNHSTGK